MRAAHGGLRRAAVWVVGASRGIGKEIAAAFGAAGCDVCLSGRSARGLEAAAREIVRLGGRATAVPCDLLDDASIRRAAAAVVRRHGRIDVLINCGGITVFAPFAATTQRQFDAILGTNLRGPVLCTREALRSMERRKEGMIINILSTASVLVFTGSSAYTAAKAGLLGFSAVLREELRGRNIKIVNVLPGATNTAMWSASARKKFGSEMMSPR